MRSKYFILLSLLLVLIPLGTTNSQSNSIESISSQIREISIDQSQPWYSESIDVDFSSDGYISTNVDLSGIGLSFDTLEADSLVPSEYRDLFKRASVWTNEAFNPFDENLYVNLVFETNEPDIAENIANTMLSILGSQIPLDLVFVGSRGYDGNLGDGWKSYTEVSYRGHVDWTNFKELIDRSVPRSYGGLAGTIDVFPARSLNFDFWIEGNNQIAASIGLHYQEMVRQLSGGHFYSLQDLAQVTGFSVASFSSELRIHINLPDVTNINYSLTNTTYTTVEIKNFPPLEPQQENRIYQIYSTILDPDGYSDITLSFDFKFRVWEWRNIDRVDWNVDQRGYSDISIGTTGKDRSTLTQNLFYNSSLFDNVLDLWLYVDFPSISIPGQHNIYLNVMFEFGIDYSTANSSVISIASELASLGLIFSDNWNFSDWDSAGNGYWYGLNQTQIQANGITFAGWMTDQTQFTNFLQNSYFYDKSAVITNTDISKVQSLNWNVRNTIFGKATSVNLRINQLHFAISSPSNSFVQNSQSIFNVNLLDPVNLGWGGNIPWNSYSEALEVRFSSPFTGNFEDVSFTPIENNGWAWESGRYMNNLYQTNGFDYSVWIYDSAPQQSIWQNNQWVNIGPLNEISVSYSNYYFDLTVDLEAPYANNLWYENKSGQMSDEIGDYNQYFRIDESIALSGNQNLAIDIYEDASYYWTGTDWKPRFAMAGIKNATSFLFRTDAPIDLPIFTRNLEFTRNATWIYDRPENQIWDATMDTTTFPDGEWRVLVDVFDNENNYGTREVGVIQIDNFNASYQPSVITWTNAPIEGSGVEDIVWFNFTVNDDAGIYAVIAWNNLGGYFQNPITSSTDASGVQNTYAFKVDTLAQGLPENTPMTITIEVLDMDGNWSYQSVQVFIDNLKQGNPPTISIFSPSNNAVIDNTQNSKIIFQATIEDDWGITSATLFIRGPKSLDFEMFFNADSGYFEYTADIDLWLLGEYSWKIQVVDVDENQHAVTSQFFSFEIVGLDPDGSDSQAPDIALITPNDGASVTGTVEIRALVTDFIGVSQVTLAIPEGQIKSMTEDITDEYIFVWDSLSVIDGVVEFTITAKDTVGNTATYNFELFSNNGRTRSDPEIGLSGFQLYLAVPILVLIPIIRRKFKT